MAKLLVLQNFLPYLLNRAGMRIGALFSEDIASLGVTLPMWRVMTELWHNGDHRLGDLAERTSIDISTLSRLIASMQRKKLVVRRRSGVDGRALSLTLTDKGLKLTKRIAPYALYYEEVAIDNLTEAEVAQLKDLLTRVFHNLDRKGRAGGTAVSAPKRTLRRRMPNSLQIDSTNG